MNTNTIENKKLKLDHLGQYYASVNNKKNTGTFSVTANLTEEVDASILQLTVNRMCTRLPFINVKLEESFFEYKHCILDVPIKIQFQRDCSKPAKHFDRGETLTRVMYGKRFITLEVLHTVCDGRTLAKILNSLLADYFDLSETTIRNSGLIDFHHELQATEIEDNYRKFADTSKGKKEKTQEVYVPNYNKNQAEIIEQTFDINDVKQLSKDQGISITEFFMAGIFKGFKNLRDKLGSNGAITINVPMDCRGFFPSETMRNFVSSKTIIMDESDDDKVVKYSLKQQLTSINKEYIQSKISEFENMIRLAKYVPLFIKKWLIKLIGGTESKGNTTGFSNLGFIKLPNEIANKVERFSFALGAEPNMPYQFACVSTGDKITLTATVSAEDKEVVNNIFDVLRMSLGD